ncbi:hypothetical protein QBC37DRAFT_381845 [Rhypophila decipiens]|uniref:Fucose-specific lectin n=1 Tax=Rhypophila decipiens TaxID=261697 RepID=A0AAN6YPR4_9PEZI|nr:hypothetical protein QBC37DRAFT_381845 [Rhypophila decipiens]
MPEQPGLEVAYRNVQPSLEVWKGPDLDSPDKEAVPHYDKEAVRYHQTQYGSAPEVLDTTPKKKSTSRKRLLWIIGTLVVLMVILAAVLGGVLGSKASKSTSPAVTEAGPKPAGGPGTGGAGTGGAGNSTNSNSTSTDIPRPKTLRQGSSLSVTGWRNMDGHVEKYLTFQTPQDELRLMKSPGVNGSWEAPMSFNAYPKPDTKITATILMFQDYFRPQIEIFYTGKQSRFLGTNYNDQNPGDIKFVEDSVNSLKFFTGLNSSLASYWPWIIQQDSDGTLVHVRDRLGGDFGPNPVWDRNRLNATAQAGSSLAIVPLSTNFSAMAVEGGYAAFYQQIEGGTLAVEVPSLATARELFENYSLSWDLDIPTITLPRRAQLAAFSVARDDAESWVNTYVLYIDEEDNINVLYTDMSTGVPVWTIVQPEQLKGVDTDSSLACLTLASSPAGPSGGPILLEVGSEDNMRCYFVRGGLVQEAKLSEFGGWSVVGVVPIP